MADALFSPSSPRNHWCISFNSSNRSSPSSITGFPSLRFKPSTNGDVHGRKIVLQLVEREPRRRNFQALQLQMKLSIGNARKWWEKGLQPNMKEIASAQDLVDSLLNAGDKLVIVDFFSPSCGGCRALHPKISQFAEMNKDVQFLQVNYEEHKSMCYTLNVHVLPFFRFYRGAHGRLCSFSCTNGTIKKFKDALAKHTTERCSLCPTKGLEESELLALAANRDLCFNYTPKVPAQPPVFIPIDEQKDITTTDPANLEPFPPSTSMATKGD